MTRSLAFLAVVLFVLSGCVWADDKAQEDAGKKADPAAERLKENPDDAQALQVYVGLQGRRILPLVESDPEQAERRLAELRKLLEGLEPTTEEAQGMVEQAKAYVSAIDRRLKLARTTLDELFTQLKDAPGDLELILLFQNKANSELYRLAMYRPDEGEKKLAEITAFLNEQQEAAEDEDVKSRYETALASLERNIGNALERGREVAETLGKDAAPLNVEAWANGEPLTDEDLKGKVVLLDFWAVWCGPCIATFPHLREWQEKYADEGLVIIGLTRYYNYTWDEEAGRASRAEDEVAPEDEQKMLDKFAEHHELEHRFAIQKDDTLSEYYHVSGIPHVVLLDREGKVRLYRIGSGEQNAKDIEAEIKELLAEGKS
jgi:thiol-disulfide isomerase/thioredoxin